MAFKRGLAYTGIAQPTPPNEVVRDREPTANDYQSFSIGDIWIVPTQGSAPSQQMWVLMSKAQNQAIWVDVTSGGSTTYNNHEILVGTGTSTINTINNSTAGLPLLTQGVSADPTWGVLQVPAGGTSVSSFVAYTPVCGGTTSTAGLQSVASIGLAGQVLTSRGAGLLPTFQGTGPIGSITNINVQYKTATGAGIYTPTTGMVQCMVECIGGGAGATGAARTDAVDPTDVQTNGCASAGYTRKLYTAADIGPSQAFFVGAGGAGGVGVPPNSGNPGADGEDTTFMAMTAGGAIGGQAFSAGTAGAATGGDINIPGSSSTTIIGGGTLLADQQGASSPLGYGFGGATITTITPGTHNGNPGTGYGSGGGGCNGSTTGPGTAICDGGAGAPGVIIITEYIQ